MRYAGKEILKEQYPKGTVFLDKYSKRQSLDSLDIKEQSQRSSGAYTRKVKEMRLVKNEKEWCEISGCGGRAEYTINLNRSGIRSKIHICRECLKNLYMAVGEALIPKSIETIKKSTVKI